MPEEEPTVRRRKPRGERPHLVERTFPWQQSRAGPYENVSGHQTWVLAENVVKMPDVEWQLVKRASPALLKPLAGNILPPDFEKHFRRDNLTDVQAIRDDPTKMARWNEISSRAKSDLFDGFYVQGGPTVSAMLSWSAESFASAPYVGFRGDKDAITSMGRFFTREWDVAANREDTVADMVKRSKGQTKQVAPGGSALGGESAVHAFGFSEAEIFEIVSEIGAPKQKGLDYVMSFKAKKKEKRADLRVRIVEMGRRRFGKEA